MVAPHAVYGSKIMKVPKLTYTEGLDYTNVETQNMSVITKLSCSGSAEFSSTVTIAGNVSIEGTFSCTGAAEFSSTATIAGNVSIQGTLSCAGNAEFSGTVQIAGAVTMAGTVSVAGNFAISTETAPTTHTADSKGFPGQLIIPSDGSFLYVCYQTSNWARVALTNTTAFN